LGGLQAVKWLKKEWANVHRLKQDGVPVNAG
jgi:serine/threonine-protein kinase RIO1